MKREGIAAERPETVGRGRAFGVSDTRGVSRAQVQVAHAKLVLSLHPGHATARQQLIRLRQALLSKLVPEDAEYGVIADIGGVLDADVLAHINRQVTASLEPELGPPSRQDPVMALYRLGKLDAQQLRAAQEIQQVAEMLAWANVGGVRAMDPSGIRVDGGGYGGLDLATFRAGHHALGRVNDFMATVRADSRRFQGRDGRKWSLADIIRAVIIDRVALNEVERKIIVRHRVVRSLIADQLARYADDAKVIWSVMDDHRYGKEW